VSTQGSGSIRIVCPQCGGNVKVPPYQAGQRCACPRCGAAIVVPDKPATAAAQTDRQVNRSATLVVPAPLPPSPAAVVAEATTGPAAVAARQPAARQPAAPQPAAPPPAASKPAVSYDDVYGISCPVCQTRLHVRPHQAGTTLKCPDCYSTVPVTTPPKRKQPPPAGKFATESDDPSAAGPTAVQATAQKMLDKARADLEQAEAEEREQSPDRFVQGLFDFFLDPHAIVRLVLLAIWFSVAGALIRQAMAMRISEDASAVLNEVVSVGVAVLGGFFLLTFALAAAACAWALVHDTSEGMRKIEHWPGINLLAWDRDLRYVVSAGFLAALPGAIIGIVLGLIGITGLVLYIAAATFGALFPPILLSMYQSRSILTPFAEDAWGSIRERPAPWNLTYLLTSVVIILGLFGTVTALLHSFPLGLAGALLMVACMAVYFRTIGRLFGYLAGRDG
jgi:DNA-directed RNA polymerase subunit M/transcription elongation factor TFIIS